MVEEQEKSRGERLAERFIQAGKNAREREKNMILVRKALAEEKLAGAKPSKKEIKDFTKNYKKQTQGRQAYSNIKYGRTIGGKITASFRAIRSPTATLYRRNMTLAQQKEFDKRFKAMQRVKQQPQQRVIYKQPIQAPENNLAWITSDFRSPQFDVASQTEREVLNHAGGGVSTEGDRLAWSIGNEANFMGNFATFNPLINVEREVSKHSRTQHFNPIKSMNSEVDFFSRLLD